MATSPLFGWEEPDDIDLVKDGAAAMRTLGNAIDTSMGDLLGGTSGQILAKASNTNMDFTWVTNDVGDITAVTAGTGLTGGGTSGAVSLAFDQANYGGGQYAAGKNKLINADFAINQRAFTSTTTNGTYTFDRWRLVALGGTSTLSAETFTPGAAPVAGYESKNFARLVSTGQSGTSDNTRLGQRIEDVRTFAGQTVTISFWAKASTGTPSVAAYSEQEFGSGGSAAVRNNGNKVAITSSWARYSVSLAVASVSGKTIGTGSFFAAFLVTSAGSTFDSATNSLGLQSVTIDFWGVQVESGSIATPFQTASGSIQGELALCQRYYYRQVANFGARFGDGHNNATTQAEFITFFPVEMRVAPTALETTGTATDYSIRSANTSPIANAVPTFNAGTNIIGQFLISVASGLTLGFGAFARSNATGAYLGWSAEL